MALIVSIPISYKSYFSQFTLSKKRLVGYDRQPASQRLAVRSAMALDELVGDY